MKILQQNASAGENFSNTDETIIERRNGERVHIEYSAKGVRIGNQTYMFSAVRNITEPYSRDGDAQDVDLDGPVVEAVTARLLDRAEAASDLRGREYLRERIARLVDDWKGAMTGSTRLGYRKRTGKQPLNGLLDQADGTAWTALTVPMSMRETENEINLLVPGGSLFDPVYGQPAWSFAVRDNESAAEGPDDADDVPDADELGESVADGQAGGR